MLCLQKVPGAVNSNQMVGNRLSLRLGRVIEMLLRGPACFDFDSFIKASPDLESWSPEQLWLHFVLEDQFSGRKFWYICCSTCFQTKAIDHLRTQMYVQVWAEENVCFCT